MGEEEVKAGTQIWIMPVACAQDEPRHARTREGAILTIGLTNAERSIQRTDEGKWPAEEHMTLLDAVKPGESFRQPGVYANMRGDYRKQLCHVKKRVDPGIACMATGPSEICEHPTRLKRGSPEALERAMVCSLPTSQRLG